MKLVLCNTPPDRAEPIARAVVERKLAACVNILPAVRSLYIWEGKVCDDAEATLLLKVAAEGVDALRAALVELHPYDLVLSARAPRWPLELGGRKAPPHRILRVLDDCASGAAVGLLLIWLLA